MNQIIDALKKVLPATCTCRVANKAEDVTTTLAKCPVHGDGPLDG